MPQEFNRRSLLAAMVAGGAFAVVQTPSAAAEHKPFFERIGLPVGLQIYTLGEEAARDLGATFAKCAAIGYRDIELPSLYGRTPAAVRQAADQAGLMISSLHLGVSTRGPASGLSLTSAPSEIADSLGVLGAKRAVLPIMLFPENMRPQPGESVQAAIGRAVGAAGEDLWKRTAALLNERGAALKPLGVQLGYHNHNVEFAPVGKTNGWEILAKETDPAVVSFEIDVGWVATAGLDPAAFLKRHSGRVTQLHVKDVAAGNSVNYALSMKPAEVGAGKLDWARILPAAYDAGVRHFYVEQEPPFAIPRMEAVARSYAYLSKLKA
ncbi:sugar phosphate isomerase/epimerase [Phenylobacterium sp. LjRoot225]|uniref:sugar phosphate isomerase/epimerase family protein n=1 Tax=Phenylobacterium sp. LjRoot225 TaxID=3342285 RepID=UPI003ECCF45A